jgi:hypothetical protein
LRAQEGGLRRRFGGQVGGIGLEGREDGVRPDAAKPVLGVLEMSKGDIP